MYISSHFSPYSPTRPFLSGAAPSSSPSGLPLDAGAFSGKAHLFMMMAALQNMMSLFRAEAAVPMAPRFGLLPRGLPGPTRCFLGPSRFQAPRPQSAPGVGVQSGPVSGGAAVRPLAQSNSVSCGQASVAMAVNALTGKSLTDRDINSRYGFSLLSALNGESRQAGYSWRDGGNFQHGKWPLLEKKLNQEKTPVLIGLNGPQFSPSGRGHIVTLLSVNGDTVRYADPADGKIKTTTRRAIETAPSHPDGKFIFYASRG